MGGAGRRGGRGAGFWIVECVLPRQETGERLLTRTREGTALSGGGWELYDRQRGAGDAAPETAR